MAAVAGHRNKGARAFKLAGIDKENISPKKAKAQQKHKKIRDANGIFNYPYRVAEERETADRTRKVLSTKFAGISKLLASRPGYFTSLHQRERAEAARASAKKVASTPSTEIPLGYAQRQKEEAISFGLAETIKPYIEATTNAWIADIKEQHKQLEAIRHGIDYKTGKPLNRPGIPSIEDCATLAKELEDGDEPFEKDEVTLQFKNPDGSITIRPVRIGELVDKFMKRRDKQNANKKKLEQALNGVEEEIEELRQDINDDPGAGEKADRDFEKQMKAFEKEKKDIEAQAKAERAALREEQKRRTEVLNAKIQELLTLT